MAAGESVALASERAKRGGKCGTPTAEPAKATGKRATVPIGTV